MTILDEIIAKKKIEITELKEYHPIGKFEESMYFDREIISATASIRDPKKSGIIAEHKRKSPSKGIINANANLVDVVQGYEAAGASCISVLTEKDFFSGNLGDLLVARKYANIPLLRKDFIVDEFQVLESRAAGADFILLIAACLTKEEVQQYARLAKSVGLEILFEIHTEEELEKLCPELDIIGVNNRNLKDFSVDIERSVALFDKIPSDFVKITESGISSVESVQYLKKNGFEGFLMGENFMKEENPSQACADFIKAANLIS